MRTARAERSSTTARGRMRTAITREATASARVHPVRATTAAAMMTPTDPRASLRTSRKAAFILRLSPCPSCPRPPERTSSAMTLAASPMTPMMSMPEASTCGATSRLWTALKATNTPTTASMPAWSAAPMTSARRIPQVERSVAGRMDRCAAVRAMIRPTTSVSMCPASARSASEPVSSAMTISATRTVTDRHRATRSRPREAPAPWLCEWPWEWLCCAWLSGALTEGPCPCSRRLRRWWRTGTLLRSGPARWPRGSRSG